MIPEVGGGLGLRGPRGKGSPSVSRGPKPPIQLLQLLKNCPRKVKRDNFRYILVPRVPPRKWNWWGPEGKVPPVPPVSPAMGGFDASFIFDRDIERHRGGFRKSPRKGLLETRRPSIIPPVGSPILPPLRGPLKVLPFLRNWSDFTHFFRRPLFSFYLFIFSYLKKIGQGRGYSPHRPSLVSTPEETSAFTGRTRIRAECEMCHVSCVLCHVSFVNCCICVSCVMYHVSCVVCRVSCVMCRVSCVVCRVSCVVCHVSCVVCRVSCVMCRVSCVVCHVSCVMCRVSCVMCRVSCVMCHVSCIMCHASCAMCHCDSSHQGFPPAVAGVL